MASTKMENLLDYCSKGGITIDASVRVEDVPGAGWGVYSTKEIAAGQQIVFVPAANILVHEAIPVELLDAHVSSRLPIHAQFAAFFTFGSPEQLAQYQPWIKTWPKLTDFSATMPMFHGPWAKYILKQLGRTNAPVVQPAKRRRIEENISLSPALSSSFTAPLLDADKDSNLRKICDRLIEHVRAIDQALPHLNLIRDDLQLIKFLHYWCAVNTRCFSYWIPSAKYPVQPPKDPNEAMGLIPFMDLFNHCAPPPPDDDNGERTPLGFCNVKQVDGGFRVAAVNNIPADTEIMTAYGRHNNDLLWSEYGFILNGDKNTEDNIRLDEIVLGGMNERNILALSDHRYIDKYELFHDGSVCYRTQQAAWLLAMGREDWTALLRLGLNPEDNVDPGRKRIWEDEICSWLSAVKGAAYENIAKVDTMKQEDLQRSFGTMSIIQDNRVREHSEMELTWCRRRANVCTRRWTQIAGMADRGITKIMDASERDIDEASDFGDL